MMVVLVLEVLAWLFLWTHGALSSGSPSFWVPTLAVWGVLPVLSTLSFVWAGRLGALYLVLAEAVILFWASVPDGGLLPSRWLAFSGLVALSCTVLPLRWRAPLASLLLAELATIDHAIPGMVKAGPDAVTSFTALVCVALPGTLLSAVERARSQSARMAGRNAELHTAVLQLTSANTEFLEQANTAGEESAVLERHRITRDLHDVVGQTLTNIIMMMDASLHRKVHEPEETVKLLKWIRKQAQTGLEETRAVLYELRALKPTRLRGIKALKKLIETFSRLSGIKTKVSWGNLPWTFDPDQEQAVYHLVQGSLSNAFRHRSPTRIDLHFQVDEARVLRVMIRDNGRGGPDSALGIGQRGMEERLARWGGTVTFRNEPFGYVVHATVPFQEDTDGSVQDPDRR